jgi:hypothetical protein
MAITPGSLANFSGSMAQAIETELDALLLAEALPGLLKDDSPESRDVRRLLVAIARGVVKHLESHENDIKIAYLDSGTNRTTHPDFIIDWS